MRSAFAWAGGGAFVAALVSFGLFYSVALGRDPGPTAGPAGWAVASNIALFTLFAAHHSLMARSGAKAWIARTIPADLERSVYVWIASLLLMAVAWFWQPLGGVAWRLTGPAAWMGRGAQLAGVWLTIRGAGVIDVLELAGIRQAAGDRRATAFKVAGPFRLVRHPIYLGWVLMVGAVPLMTWDRLLLATISSTYLFVAIPWEERSLVAAFGDQYRAYQRQVRWRIVPGIW